MHPYSLPITKYPYLHCVNFSYFTFVFPYIRVVFVFRKVCHNVHSLEWKHILNSLVFVKFLNTSQKLFAVCCLQSKGGNTLTMSKLLKGQALLHLLNDWVWCDFCGAKKGENNEIGLITLLSENRGTRWVQIRSPPDHKLTTI